MRILVIGRQGQVARSLVEAPATSGLEIIAEGRPDFDLREPTATESLIRRRQPDVVVNAAAYTQVDKAESDEQAAANVNATGAAHIAESCERHDVPLIHISTDYVFDGRKTSPYLETDFTNPINAYGRTKLAGETMVAKNCRKHLILRTSWVFSPWGSNFVLTMLRLAMSRPTLNVVDDQHGCPTYAPHLAEALINIAQLAASEPDRVRWGIYHAAGQGETSWCGLAQQAFQHALAAGLSAAHVQPIMAEAYPTPARRPMNSRLDCHALSANFGLVLPRWQNGVEACIAHVAADQQSA